MLTWEVVEKGLGAYLELLRATPAAQAEFEASRGEFFDNSTSALTPGAELRHLEWFLFERPSTTLGAIPVQAWQDAWAETMPAATPELLEGYRQSLPGAFEVTSVVHGEGLWVRDLFTQGEHPVAEAGATNAIAVGDLLVGRLYPAGGEVFLLSPAVSAFRNPVLLEAVRVDLAKMRSVRRGVLRVQQLELERLFHPSGGGLDNQTVIAEIRSRARQGLLALGLSAETVQQELVRLHDGARRGDGLTVTEILNGLAFATSVDLASARLLLVELWEEERRGRNASAPVPQTPASTDAREALEAFDRGRAEGKDLEVLFRQLEKNLGVELEEAPDPDEAAGAPDFPGVVGAMIEEFLWEVGREQGPESARALEPLRRLGDYGRDIGVFEELGEVRLLDFSTRWLLDESGLQTPEEAEVLLGALASFCVWCEAEQELPLWKQFGETLALLRVSVPRHIRLRAYTKTRGEKVHIVVEVDEGRVILRDRAERESTVEVTPSQAEFLDRGDLVRIAYDDEVPQIGWGYPAELGAYLG